MIVPGTTSFELTNNYKFLPTINPPNDPPEKPVIDNPKKVHVNTEYEFHVSSFDPNHDHIYFKIIFSFFMFIKIFLKEKFKRK